MEFKKPNRYDGVRPRPAASRYAGPTLSPRPAPTPPSEPSPAQPPHAPKKPAGISIHFGALPSKTAAILHVRKFLFSKKGIIVGGVVVIIGGALLAGSLIHQHNIAKKSDDTNKLHEAVDDLEYQTILPTGKSISQLGGWRRVSPSKAAPVYAYADKIDDIPISVSEQPLPKTFVGDTDDQVSELAKKFNATNKIDASGIPLYVGTSAKGPQSAIFTKNSLLVLIKSQEKIDDADWAKYVKSLN